MKSETKEILTNMPHPITIIWHVLVDKGIITRDDLINKATELSGLSEKEFSKVMAVLEGEK